MAAPTPTPAASQSPSTGASCAGSPDRFGLGALCAAWGRVRDLIAAQVEQRVWPIDVTVIEWEPPEAPDDVYHRPVIVLGEPIGQHVGVARQVAAIARDASATVDAPSVTGWLPLAHMQQVGDDDLVEEVGIRESIWQSDFEDLCRAFNPWAIELAASVNAVDDIDLLRWQCTLALRSVRMKRFAHGHPYARGSATELAGSLNADEQQTVIALAGCWAGTMDDLAASARAINERR